MGIGYTGEIKDIIYDTEGTQTGLTDLKFTVYLPSGSVDTTQGTLGVVTMTEVGSTGIYKGAFTPTSIGTWLVIVNSPSSNPAIANKAGTVEVSAYSPTDSQGIGFNAATDTQQAIRAAIDGVAGAINAPSARGSVMV